jgi:parallel beta-helix repeat protein/predicted outer membrane repeat protein
MMRVAAAMMALLVCGVTTAATFNVPGNYSTIQAAVDVASDGDEILVAPGIYTSSHPGHVVDTRSKAIAIRSTGGAAVTTINGEDVRRGLACFSGEVDSTIVEGFTIKSCFSSDYDYDNSGSISTWERSGGGILCHESSPTLTDCIIDANTTNDDGGGIYCYSNSDPTINNCTISGNTGGGIYCDGSSPTITECTITNHSGSGIYCDGGSPTITGCTISDNTTTRNGGGIYCYSNSSPTITGCVISGNAANGTGLFDGGGGIYCQGGSPTISGCTITNNTANGYGSSGTGGGGIYCYSSDPTITGCEISNNTAINDGGGIYCEYGSDPTITGCMITGNTASSGGGIYSNNSDPTISGCEISDNTANDSGGGIYCVVGSDPTITDCTISGNTADYGGGIYCSSNSDPTLIDTSVCGNQADQIYGPWIDGGGVCLSFSCDDNDGDGTPDACQGSIDDGIHEVPSEFGTIQAAIQAAGHGDTVLVGPGTYTSTGDWVINPGGMPITIKSTHGPALTTIDGQWTRRVVACTSGETAATVIDGFTIKYGDADDGGGILCAYNSDPTITDCVISGNTANDDGGGIYCDDSDPTITGCTISGNTATDNGGGIYFEGDSDLTITDCTISGNTASGTYGRGGGIYCGGHWQSSSNPTITDCTISGNTAGAGGGGIYCNSYSSPTITGCTISGNTANGIDSYAGGGGIYCYSDATLNYCTITSNTAIADGGGIWCSGTTIRYSTISGNIAEDGGGIYCCSGEPHLLNCVVCGNDSEDPENQIRCAWIDDGGNTVEVSCVPAACCVDEECVMQDPSACVALGGEFQGVGTDCSNDPCTVIVGACCANEICSVTTYADCGGAWLGDGTTCDGADPCAPQGACCVDEVCSITTALECQGSWLGADTSCLDGPCVLPGTKLVPAEYPTIQAAIDAAIDGDLILVSPGTYTGSGWAVIDVSGKNLVIRSAGGSDVTILDGEDQRAVIECGGIVAFTIEGFTITRGRSNVGAGVYISGSAAHMMRDCVITANTATYRGGGVYCSTNAQPRFEQCSISQNVSSNNGGGVYCALNSAPEFRDTAINENTTSASGGAFALSTNAHVYIEGSTILLNTAAYAGAFYCTSSGSATLVGVEACGNGSNAFVCAWQDGGGNSIMDECSTPCVDVNGDGATEVHDLLAVLEHWGSDEPSADVDDDGVVGMGDLVAVLDAWGPCP